MVGKQGGDERVSHALDEALRAHDLVKIRFQDFHDELRAIAEDLASSVNAEVVSIVGHTAVMFRQNPDEQQQLIHIPKSILRRPS